MKIIKSYHTVKVHNFLIPGLTFLALFWDYSAIFFPVNYTLRRGPEKRDALSITDQLSKFHLLTIRSLDLFPFSSDKWKVLVREMSTLTVWRGPPRRGAPQHTGRGGGGERPRWGGGGERPRWGGSRT